MAELTVLLPSHARMQSAGMPDVLRGWLARGDVLPDGRPGREGALRGCFEFSGKSLPSAALTRCLDAGDAASALWLRADPCYAIADAVTVRMLASDIADLSADESEQLVRALRPLFGDAGFPLDAPVASRWYLRCPFDSRLPGFAEPPDVLGDDMLRHLPRGDNERQWRHLLNEAQVILHNHPVNARRVALGQVPVTSVWFWGAGRLPDWVRTPYTRVYSNDGVATALAQVAGVSFAGPEPTAFFDSMASPAALDGAMLLDMADMRDPAALEGDWLQPLSTALGQRCLDKLTLQFADGKRVLVKRGHRWRFWRRVGAVSGR
jgi:hypothetical protein